MDGWMGWVDGLHNQSITLSFTGLDFRTKVARGMSD